MRTGKKAKLHILLLTVCLLLIAWPAYAKNEEPEPLTLTVEADPTCLLSEAGEMTFFRFKVKNNLNEEYVLEDMSLQGDILSAPFPSSSPGGPPPIRLMVWITINPFLKSI